MGYIKESSFYQDVIKEIRYSCGTYYLFDTFIISEIDEGIVFTWDDHAKPIVAEVSELYGQRGENLVLISNRVNSYSVKPSDWIKFFKSDYNLKGYAIVSYSRKGIVISLIEKLFMKSSFQSFDNLDDAIIWAKSLTQNPEENAKDKSA